MNELHNRLEYLVSYSSQLIFIGCDSLAQQQSAMQRFLSSQHENVEVAYVTGESGYKDSDFRTQIYQQLLNEPASQNAPLDTHLIEHFSQDMGPVLICICGAEHISDGLLNELWSVVVRNKDQGGGHHLNVLLFAATKWTHDAKVSLSEKHTHTPILLSTETVSSDNPLLTLEDSITQNRDRIRAKMLNNADQSIIQQPWFKLLSGVLFLILFGIIIYWQYPQEISQFLQPTYNDSEQALAKQKQLDNELVSSNNENDEPDQVPLAQTNTPPAAFELQSDTQASISGSAPAKVHHEANNLAIVDVAIEKQQVDQQLHKTDLQVLAKQSETLVTDWQIEVDKFSQDVTESVPRVPSTTDSIPPADELSDQVSNPLLTLKDNSYVLQLAAMSDPIAMQSFIDRHGLDGSSWTYTTWRFGGDWHVIVFAKVFDDLQQARDYVSSLPASIDRRQPFAKSNRQIKEELSAYQNH